MHSMGEDKEGGEEGAEGGERNKATSRSRKGASREEGRAGERARSTAVSGLVFPRVRVIGREGSRRREVVWGRERVKVGTPLIASSTSPTETLPEASAGEREGGREGGGEGGARKPETRRMLPCCNVGQALKRIPADASENEKVVVG